MNISSLDLVVIAWFRKWYVPLGRLAVFVIYFYFGFLKLIGESPATPLASALVERTVGLAHFDALFMVLAVFECVIGILFLIPKATRVVIPMILIHMLIVCAPLIMLPSLVFAKPFVPSLEGQYIIKNVAIVALAVGVAAQTPPLSKKSKHYK